MDKNHRRGEVLDSGIEALPRMDDSLVYQPFGYVVDFDYLVCAVKRNGKEVLLLLLLPPP